MARPALAAKRAAAVLELMSSNPRRVFTLSDLSARLDINYASLHAIMAVLEETGFTSRHPSHKTYELGPAAVALGFAALERNPFIDVARDEIRRLAAEVDLEVLAVARVADEMVVVARAGRATGAWVNPQVGQRISLHPPLGLAFIAWEDEAELERWLTLAGTDVGPLRLENYRRVVAAIRRQGYSVGLEGAERARLGGLIAEVGDPDGDAGGADAVRSAIADLEAAGYQLEGLEEGRSYDVAVMNAPIFDDLGRPVLLLSMAGYRRALTSDEVREYGERLRAVGLRVTSAGNGRAPG